MLKKRLYFLFPNRATVSSAVNELREVLDSGDYRLHVVGMIDGELKTLPEMSDERQTPENPRVERMLVVGGSLLFALALIALGATLLAGAWVWSVLLAAIAILIQLSGYLLPDRRGRAALDQFRDPLEIGELLLMVDLPRRRVPEVMRVLESHHHDVKSVGTIWFIDVLPH